MNRNLWIAIGFMAMGMSLIPVGDAIAKQLSNTTAYSAPFLAWARFGLGACVLLPLAFRTAESRQLPKTFFLKQSLRGLLIALTVVTIIKAVSLSPIAEVFGCFFIGPVLSVVLSIFVLNEKASLAQWVSVVLGFIGVLLVVQPGFLGFEATSNTQDVDRSGLYWALLAGVFYGSFLVATRWAASVGPPLSQVAVQFAVAALLITPFAIANLISVGLVSVPLLIASSLSSVLANYFSIQALGRVTAAALAPVVYMQVVAATIIGLLFFNESLSIVASIGLALIIFSGFFRMRMPALKVEG